MGRHRVIDLRRWLDANGVPRPEHLHEAEWVGGIVEIVTACRTAARWEAAATHCEDPGCYGRVAVRRIGEACEWFCASCSSSGAVVGFRNSPFDLTEIERADETDRSDALVFTRLDELIAVRRMALPADLRLALALAAAHADYVIVPFAEKELTDLLAALEEMDDGIELSDQRLIDRFSARIDAALLACEARKVEPPTVH